MEFLMAGIVVLLALVAALVVPMDRIAFVAACAFCVVVTWNGFRLGGGPVEQGGGGGGALSNAFLLVALAAAAASTMIARRPIRVPPWMLIAAAGFLLAAMINLIFPPDSYWVNQTLLSYRTDFSPPPQGPLVPQADLLLLARLILAMVLIPIMFTLAATTVSRVKRLIDCFCVSTVVNAGVGIVDFAGIHIAPRASRAGREAGLTIHPNYLALTCTIGIPLALWWVSRGGRWRIAGLVSLGILLGGAFVAGGRAGAISAPLAVIVTVAAIPKLRRGLGFVLPIGGVLIVMLLAFTATGDQLLEQVRFQGDPTTTGSDNARSHLASLALDQFEARPLQGVGFSVIQDAHSIYLQLLAAGGLIALASFLTYLWGLWGTTRLARAGPERDVATAAGIAVLMWLVNGTIDNQLADKYLYVVPGLLVALGYAAKAVVSATEQEPAPPAAAPRRAPVRDPVPAPLR